MKCLSVCQPWAWKVSIGWLQVLNVHWKTRHRGPLLIHADRRGSDNPQLNHLDFGKLVAHASLIDCVHIEDLTKSMYARLAGSERAEGPWCWILGNVRRVEPISFAGSLGLFSVPADVVERLVYCDEVKA